MTTKHRKQTKRFLEKVLQGLLQARPARLHPDLVQIWLNEIPMHLSVAVDTECGKLHLWPAAHELLQSEDLRATANTIAAERTRQALFECTILRLTFAIDLLTWNHEDFPAPALEET